MTTQVFITNIKTYEEISEKIVIKIDNIYYMFEVE